ncbi:NAD(P)/FAD-dependent oxidoreductase [Gilvimarinus sp. SDUM040013]|uniref:NAD(P)/FAD-dependent oxidoreductase n=1 Tax=Gilvimarinus gilvus TaxID=3058038 RepID=A0ABU4RZC8_9GAMM|nr:NAD(P)/FAD-dependent oxidoreductase [Gilvimarinus sp. SDUM040013]MDO3387284.1 NAD(P)/FAD-dependent oxidoreductase [Gilvimarinus sp. SDUM040013]MDX6848973.1 NAD(P)/FAD-dependent oxidoreductase [Gilvimarinus sp. SDUM040013]
MKRIVVVGGGAGGLELVTKLGRKFGRKGKAHVTLIDKNTTHVWKPLLHEIAVGTMDEGVDAVSYRAHAFDNHYHFRIGTMADIDREAKQVVLTAMHDEDGQELLPETRIDYDILVLAMGSSSNDFNTPGVKDHCIFLDGPKQAHRFRNKLLGKFLRIQRVPGTRESVNVAIVGGGATGVELSAELHHAVAKFHAYGFDAIDNKNINVTLVEAGPRILPALPERISAAASRELAKLGVNIKLNTRIVSATAAGLETADDTTIKADLMVWAAGVKVTDALKNIGGIATNRINQVPVNSYLQIKNEANLFAIGDCAEFVQADGTRVPPRAQSAHQMADICFHNICTQLNGGTLKVFRYKDHGSLVSLSNYSTVGSLMGNLSRGTLFLEGRLARLVYVSLYRMHQVAIHGYIKTALVMLSGSINRWLKPKLKLH